MSALIGRGDAISALKRTGLTEDAIDAAIRAIEGVSSADIALNEFFTQLYKMAYEHGWNDAVAYSDLGGFYQGGWKK